MRLLEHWKAAYAQESEHNKIALIMFKQALLPDKLQYLHKKISK
jgi:hypothetical protein